jgi:ATP-binding cassette, subfamily B, multidrug efflux pump
MANQEEEVLGKAYDARLMRRLLGYLKPYTWQVVIALLAIVLKAGADVLGPYLTKVAVDKYMAHSPGAYSFLDRWLSSKPLTGIGQIGGLYLALLGISCKPTSCSGPARR